MTRWGAPPAPFASAVSTGRASVVYEAAAGGAGRRKSGPAAQPAIATTTSATRNGERRCVSWNPQAIPSSPCVNGAASKNDAAPLTQGEDGMAWGFQDTQRLSPLRVALVVVAIAGCAAGPDFRRPAPPAAGSSTTESLPVETAQAKRAGGAPPPGAPRAGP